MQPENVRADSRTAWIKASRGLSSRQQGVTTTRSLTERSDEQEFAEPYRRWGGQVVFGLEGLPPHPNQCDTAYPQGSVVGRQPCADPVDVARSAVDGCRPATSIDGGGGATSSACLLGFDAIVFVEIVFLDETVFLDGIAFPDEIRRDRRATDVRRTMVSDANAAHFIRRDLVAADCSIRIRDNKVQIRRRRTIARIDAVKHDEIGVATAEVVKDNNIARGQLDLDPAIAQYSLRHRNHLPPRRDPGKPSRRGWIGDRRPPLTIPLQREFPSGPPRGSLLNRELDPIAAIDLIAPSEFALQRV